MHLQVCGSPECLAEPRINAGQAQNPLIHDSTNSPKRPFFFFSKKGQQWAYKTVKAKLNLRATQSDQTFFPWVRQESFLKMVAVRGLSHM